MVTINIHKKDFWLISAILVFIVGIGLIIAYNPGLTGGTPSVHGHSVDEVEGAGTGGGGLECATILLKKQGISSFSEELVDNTDPALTLGTVFNTNYASNPTIYCKSGYYMTSCQSYTGGTSFHQGVNRFTNGCYYPNTIWIEPTITSIRFTATCCKL
jgi:hypothetical protein